MSYCRWSRDSDVYMYFDGKTIYCCSCQLDGNHSFLTQEEAIEHLRLHRKLGDKVPDFAFEKLQEEIE